MNRPEVWDCFMFAGELDLLECRLVELDRAVDHFVLVEAAVDHQDHPKPLHYAENAARYGPWHDRIVHVVADRLPTVAEDPDPWAREHAQREWIRVGLERAGADADDIVLQSDVDEIPTAVAARNVRPQGRQMCAFDQRGHFWAVDWQYPPGWRGTVAARYATIGSFGRMRDVRNLAPPIRRAGWHFSWLGGPDLARAKVETFCHPEVRDRIVGGAERYWRDGIHVDGIKLDPVDVDDTWPVWMRQPGNVPDSWYRPR